MAPVKGSKIQGATPVRSSNRSQLIISWGIVILVEKASEMAAWFNNMSHIAAQAAKFADGLVDSINEQATKAQNEIQAEQNKIKQENERKATASSTSLPWETQSETRAILSDELKDRIFRLSLADQNFTVTPDGIEGIAFSLEAFVPVALKLLSLDPNLEKIHAKLMPTMNEESFWKNYHYRITYLRAKVGIVDDPRFNFSIQKERDVIFDPPPEPVSPKAVAAVTKPIPSSSVDIVAGKKDQITPTKAAVSSIAAATIMLPSSGGKRLGRDAALAAKVEAVLDDDDDIDLADLDLDDLDGLDLDDLDGEVDFENISGEIGIPLGDDDDLDAEIERELAR